MKSVGNLLHGSPGSEITKRLDENASLCLEFAVALAHLISIPLSKQDEMHSAHPVRRHVAPSTLLGLLRSLEAPSPFWR